MSDDWYARVVMSITDMDRALAFYIGRLGFIEAWRFGEAGARIVQVDRNGCQLILSNQWPERAGTGRMFVSLDEGPFEALRSEIAEKGIEASEGRWGYRLVVVADPDGNELWFPFPTQPS